MNKIATFLRESSLARFLIPMGIILIVCGIIFFVITKQNQNYIKTEAIVSSVQLVEEAYTDVDGNHVEATYDVGVKYTVDGTEYDEVLQGITKYNIGDKMTIYYNPENPNQITQSKSLIIPLIMIIGGIAALVGGVVSGANALKRYKKMKEQEKGWANGQ